jgi:DNA (cytosine-5)-methyltransferase 1
MGFPDSFEIVVSNTQAYRQFGNSVVVPVVEEIAKSIIQSLVHGSKRITITDYVT